MKIYSVKGWMQFKNDAASEVDRIQIAGSPEEAIDSVKASFNPAQWKLVLTATEI